MNKSSVMPRPSSLFGCRKFSNGKRIYWRKKAAANAEQVFGTLEDASRFIREHLGLDRDFNAWPEVGDALWMAYVTGVLEPIDLEHLLLLKEGR